ncbi:hypothetical protein AAG570_009588 [Ranatra chinensis]|uniref:DNA ligase IV n=1 Tax=Ranatra chinensis TaxID=642074 RepID=A0ABD0Z6L9_9HEMI
MLPDLERERGAYGLKENTLAKLYVRILCLPQEGKDAQKLLNYRAPMSTGNVAGDFAEVLYWVLRNRCGTDSGLTVGYVNERLDTIAAKHAAHDPRGVDNEFIIMRNNMTAVEQKWLVRIVLKNMPLGLGRKHLLNLYHPDAQELHDVTSSLLDICIKLRNPTLRLHEVEVQLFQPFRPMLSERCDIQSLSFKGTYYLETKLDGERFQLHYDHGKFKYFSRRGFDMTDNYGEDVYSGHLSRMISRQLESSVINCILDGEMMVWDVDHSCCITKGANYDVKKLRFGKKQPCFCVFDILMLNGEVLTNKPLKDRLRILNEEVLEALNAAIERREEGVMLKDPLSIYKLNARNAGWFKIKPEYTEGAMVDLDLLILGGYYSGGRRRSQVSHFLLGLKVPNTDKFESICRVGSGYTMEELAELNDRLQLKWVKFNPSSIPDFLLFGKERPDMWIHPQNSHVLQVKATEVIRSNDFLCGYTLRFVRVECVRYDKAWSDVLTTGEFHEIRNRYAGKLTAGPISKKISRKRKSNDELVPWRKVERISEIFKNKEICVMSGSETSSKQDLEGIIIKNGGKIVATPTSNTYCIVIGDSRHDIRVKNVINSKKHDVVLWSWLLKCQESSRLLPWKPNVIVSSTMRTQLRLSKKYDRYGDSFTKESSLETLREVLKRARDSGDARSELTLSEMKEIDLELFPGGTNPYSPLRGCIAFFDIYAALGDSSSKRHVYMTTEVLLFRFLAGIVSSEIVPGVTTHVVVHSQHRAHLKEVEELKRKAGYSFSVVSNSWVLGCWEAREKLDEAGYSFFDTSNVENQI